LEEPARNYPGKGAGKDQPAEIQKRAKKMKQKI
jgi:hypothetical protein